MPAFNYIGQPVQLEPVDYFDDLRDTSVQNNVDAPNQFIIVSGKDTSLDGYQGLYQFDLNSTTADNDANIIKPNSIDAIDPGRWVFIGDQVILNTGNIPNNSLSLNKLPQVTGPKVIGRDVGTGDLEELGLNVTLQASGNFIGRSAITGDVSIPAGSNFATVQGFSISGQQDGDILYFNGTTWVRLGIGSDNQVLTIDNGSLNWEDAVGGGSGTDNDAIHDNVANEISAITLKGSPVSADELIIEDSEDSYSKKSITIGDLDFSNISGGTLSELNTLVSDATLDDSGDPRNPTVTGESTNDLMYYTGGAWTRLPAGDDGYVLSSNSGTPTWEPATGGGSGGGGTPTDIGQIWYSPDGSTFQAKHPIVDGDGLIIVDGPGRIVVV